jgi:CRP-like cAMP-binding protein
MNTENEKRQPGAGTVRNCVLLDGCTDGFRDAFLAAGTVTEFEPGLAVSPYGPEVPFIGIVLSGRAVISTGSANAGTPLRFIGPGDVFGIAGVFLGVPVVTSVEALSRFSVFSIDRGAVLDLFGSDTDGAFRLAIIKLLSRKVNFLNTRFHHLAAGSNERKLALFLQSSANEEGRVAVGTTMKELAAVLGMGRASLYRAFTALEDSGLVRRDADQIVISDREALTSRYM